MKESKPCHIDGSTQEITDANYGRARRLYRQRLETEYKTRTINTLSKLREEVQKEQMKIKKGS